MPAMQAAFEKLRGFFHGCNHEQAFNAALGDVLPVYFRAIDHMFASSTTPTIARGRSSRFG